MAVNTVRRTTLQQSDYARSVGKVSVQNSMDRSAGDNDFQGDFSDVLKAHANDNDDGKDDSDSESKQNIRLDLDREYTSKELLDMMQKKKIEISENIRSGKTDPKIRIGANEYTAAEWKKLLENVDDMIDEIKEKVEKEVKEKKDKSLKKEYLKRQKASKAYMKK